MKTETLYKLIDTQMKERGVEEYDINSMRLSDGNYKVAPDGELVKDVFIDIDIIPKKAIVEIPITISIKNEDI